MTLMMMHVNDPVPDLQDLNPQVPDDLVAVINKALAKDPADRYQSAAQMAAALRNVLGRLKTGVSSAAPVPPGETLVETGPGATMVEQPSERDTLRPKANIVEAAEEQLGGTYVEPVATPPGSPPKRFEGTREEPSLPSGSGGGRCRGSVCHRGPGHRTHAGRNPAEVPAGGRKYFGMSLPLFAGALIGVLCLLGLGLFGISRIFANPGPEPTEAPVVPVVANTESATETLAPEPTATMTLRAYPDPHRDANPGQPHAGYALRAHHRYQPGRRHLRRGLRGPQLPGIASTARSHVLQHGPAGASRLARVRPVEADLGPVRRPALHTIRRFQQARRRHPDVLAGGQRQPLGPPQHRQLCGFAGVDN